MKYTAKKLRYRHFEIYDDRGIPVGQLNYNLWYSIRTAEIVVGNNVFNITPGTFFERAAHVTVGDTRVASLIFNWRGNIEIVLENGKKFLFRRERIFGGNFGLYTMEGHEIIEFVSKFKLSNFSYSFEYTTDDNYEEGRNVLILLAMLYCLNMLRARAAAAS